LKTKIAKNKKYKRKYVSHNQPIYTLPRVPALLATTDQFQPTRYIEFELNWLRILL